MVHKKSEYMLQFHKMSKDLRWQIYRDNIQFREFRRMHNIGDHYWSYQLTDEKCDCENESSNDEESHFSIPPLFKLKHKALLNTYNLHKAAAASQQVAVQTPDWLKPDIRPAEPPALQRVDSAVNTDPELSIPVGRNSRPGNPTPPQSPAQLESRSASCQLSSKRQDTPAPNVLNAALSGISTSERTYRTSPPYTASGPHEPLLPSHRASDRIETPQSELAVKSVQVLGFIHEVCHANSSGERALPDDFGTFPLLLRDEAPAAFASEATVLYPEQQRELSENCQARLSLRTNLQTYLMDDLYHDVSLQTASDKTMRDTNARENREAENPIALSLVRRASSHFLSSPTRTNRKIYNEGKRTHFVPYGWNDKTSDIGQKKTHNVCAPDDQVHSSALEALRLRRADVEQQLAVEAEKRRKLRGDKGPVNHSSIWTTEYREKFRPSASRFTASARPNTSPSMRNCVGHSTCHRPMSYRYS